MICFYFRYFAYTILSIIQLNELIDVEDDKFKDQPLLKITKLIWVTSFFKYKISYLNRIGAPVNDELVHANRQYAETQCNLREWALRFDDSAYHEKQEPNKMDLTKNYKFVV